MNHWTRNYLIIIVIIIAFHSCSAENLIEFNCEECYIDKPLYTTAQANLTINHENQEIPITIYRGSPDSNEIVFSDTITDKTLWIDIENQVEYTFVARYTRNGRTHYVTNTLKTRVDFYPESCSDPCYFVTNKMVNLRVKY